MKFIIIHTEARIELDGAISYYEGQRLGLGRDFLTEVEETLFKIQQNPNIGAPYKTGAMRRYVIQSFPYVIFYTETEENIWIIAIAHAKRRPNYWKKRQIE